MHPSSDSSPAKAIALSKAAFPPLPPPELSGCLAKQLGRQGEAQHGDPSPLPVAVAWHSFSVPSV